MNIWNIKRFVSKYNKFKMSRKSDYGNGKSINTNPNTSIEVSPNESFLNKIIEILEIVITTNENESQQEKNIIKKISLFSSNKIPSISLKDYLYRIAYYTEAEESTFIIALIYIDRLNKYGLILNSYNMHRIIFVAILIAIKFNEDNCFDFSYYSAIAGISTKELKILEIEFINLIKFELFVKKEEYFKYKIDLDDNGEEEDEDEDDIKKYY